MNINFSRHACRHDQTILGLTFFLVTLVSHQHASATTANQVIALSEQAVEVGIESQQIHESWVEEENRLLEEIEDLENHLDHIQWQRNKLSVYKSDLEEKIARLKEKAEAMEAVNMKLLPILDENLDKLQVYIDRDIPSNLSERQKYIHHAQRVLNDYDKGLLDKARTVLDAVAREVDLGHRVIVNEDEIEVDGQNRRVKLLQVGRVSLYAMTLDGEKAYQWDMEGSSWKSIENDIISIHEAIEMAEGIRLVGLSKLPVTQPEVQKLQERAAQ